MNRFFKLLSIIALLGISLFFLNCSSDKALTNTNNISSNYLINEIEQNKFSFDCFQTKFKAKVKMSGEKLSLKGQIRMKNDSIIWISVSLPIGVEVVRGIITKDSVLMINRTDKTYFKESIKNFKQIPPQLAEIGFLQSILVGNDNSIDNGDKYRVSMFDGKYNLVTNNKIYNTSNNNEVIGFSKKTILIDPKTYRICKLFLQETVKKTRKVELKYSEFENFDGNIIPTEMEVDLFENQRFRISISYSNISFDSDQNYKFSIPKKYKLVK